MEVKMMTKKMTLKEVFPNGIEDMFYVAAQLRGILQRASMRAEYAGENNLEREILMADLEELLSVLR